MFYLRKNFYFKYRGTREYLLGADHEIFEGGSDRGRGGGGDAQATRLVKVVFWFGHYRLLIVVNNFSTICSRIFNYAISPWMFFCSLSRLTGN